MSHCQVLERFGEAVSTNCNSHGMMDTMEKWTVGGEIDGRSSCKGFDERLTIALPTEWSALKPGSMS